MTERLKPKVGALLLAAGGSSRLGQPKQLLKFEGETLVRRSARSLADSIYFPVVLVLGDENEAAMAEIGDLKIFSVINDSWAEGMGSSIGVGIERLIEIEPKLDAVLITLCDQPRVSTEMLNRFADKLTETNASIVAASYDGILGVPALFSSEIFSELQTLRGDKGARQIIRSRANVVELNLPEAAFDIDTRSDAEKFGIS